MDNQPESQKINSITTARLKKDLIVWWSISLGPIIVSLILNGLEVARMIKLDILGQGIAAFLFILGVILGIIAVMRTYKYVRRKYLVLMGIIVVVVLIGFHFFTLFNQQRIEAQQRAEKIRQEWEVQRTELQREINKIPK